MRGCFADIVSCPLWRLMFWQCWYIWYCVNPIGIVNGMIAFRVLKHCIGCHHKEKWYHIIFHQNFSFLNKEYFKKYISKFTILSFYITLHIQSNLCMHILQIQIQYKVSLTLPSHIFTLFSYVHHYTSILREYLAIVNRCWHNAITRD